MTFSIQCEMSDEWAPHFLGMLKKMEWLGDVEYSREVSIFADGGGDFKPRFTWDENLPNPAEPISTSLSNYLFDVG